MAREFFRYLSQTFFQNAHHFDVNGGQFFNIASENGIVNINNAPNNDDPVSTTLWKHVAAGAIFDSAERYPPGKCHPGTRDRVIERIMDWIKDPDLTRRILWVYGPAGCGKSTLAHTICELLNQADAGKCGGSFFFARGSTDRGKALKFFVTLSYQLAVQIPAMRAEINDALSRDPSLPTKSMDAQLLSLIIRPLLRCRPLPSQHPVLIIDGLDECEDDQGMDTQRNIIILISQSIVKHNIPLRFIIASRPESWIRDTFETSPLPNITISLSLQDEEDADDDFHSDLTDECERIRMEIRRRRSVNPLRLPASANIVFRSVSEASGQSNSTSPALYRALDFSGPDGLFKSILSAYPRWPTMKRVLGGILANANTTAIETMLNVDPAEVVHVVDALTLFVDMKRPRPPSEHERLLEPIFGSLSTGRERINFTHRSFRAFLEDEARSGAYHIDVRDVQEEVIQAYFDIVHRNLDQNYATEPHLYFNIGLATYRHMMSVVEGTVTYTRIDTLLRLVNGMTQRFLQPLDLPKQAVQMECFIRDMKSIEIMSDEYLQEFDVYPGSKLPRPDELMDALYKLRDIACSLRKKAIRLLPSSSGFVSTPTFVFLSNCWRRGSRWPTIDKMFVIPGHTVSDVLSTLQQRRHIIGIDYVPMRDFDFLRAELTLDTRCLKDEFASLRGDSSNWWEPEDLDSDSE